jgi:hypothetical protein
MKLIPTIWLSFCLSGSLLSAAMTVWNGGGSNDRFSNAGNWTLGVPGGATDGIIQDALVTVGTASELQTGANVTIGGSSTLRRTSNAFANANGSMSIEGSTDVQISEWRLTDDATLNWSSTGTFSLAPAGGGNKPHFRVDKDENNANTIVNLSAGTWDLTGNTNVDAFILEAGVFNMTGGRIVTSQRFKVGTTGGGGTFNYGFGAELLAASVGLFADARLNMEAGSTLFIESGGSQGAAGFDFWEQELASSESNIYVDGVLQTIGSGQSINDSGFILGTLQLGDIWYNSIQAPGLTTAIPEPATWMASILFFFILLTLGDRSWRRRHTADR